MIKLRLLDSSYEDRSKNSATNRIYNKTIDMIRKKQEGRKKYKYQNTRKCVTQMKLKGLNNKSVFINKGKAIPVAGCGGKFCCEMSRVPHMVDNRLTDGGEFVSLALQLTCNSRKIPGTHFN
jgi:hypothetical protein